MDISVETALKDSFADSLVGDAVWQCVLAIDQPGQSRQMAEGWLKAAVAAVRGGEVDELHSAPLWVVWFRDTAAAFQFWSLWAAESQLQLDGEVWKTGLAFIQNALSSLALNYWKGSRRTARHKARVEKVFQNRAAKLVKEAHDYGTVFGVLAPHGAEISPESSNEAVMNWYNALREGAIHEHFWRDHQEYLVRRIKIDPSPQIRALNRSAEKRSAVTTAIIEHLIDVNRSRAKQLLHKAQN